MTNPVILYGTQSNGETLPVQVDSTGRLVAEGLQGPEGPDGPPGGSFPLPPDPYEGALLGWLNGGLSWVGSAPIPIPEGVFGPITSYEEGVVTVEGEIPSSVQNGVYLKQVDSEGNFYTEGWNVSQSWSSGAKNGTLAQGSWAGVFDGLRTSDVNDSAITSNTSGLASITLPTHLTGIFTVYASSNSPVSPETLGGQEIKLYTGTGIVVVECAKLRTDNYTNHRYDVGQLTGVYKIELTPSYNGTKLWFIEFNQEMLVDTTHSQDLRVNSVINNSIIGSPSTGPGLTVGKYLKVPEQRVAPWVLYGSDPSSLIDHLRSTRD